MRMLAAALLAVSTLAPQVPYDANARHIARSSRALQSLTDEGEFDTFCSGNSIGDGYHVLTAAHCVGKDTIYIDQKPASVVFKSDEHLDLAVLKAQTVTPALRMQGHAPALGQHIVIIGHPLGLPLQYFRGYISSVDTELDGDHYMLFDAEVCGGNSGSAVTNDSDEIVSVLQIGFGRGCTGFSGGAPWANVARVVAKYGRA